MVANPTPRPTGYRHREITIEGNRARLTTYQWGDRYFSAVDNVDPGAVLVRIEAASREDAEDRAIEEARKEFLAHKPR